MNSLFKTVTCSSQSDDVISLEAKHQIKTQQIFIEDLELEMFIGVFESEKKQKQRVIVNATLDVEPSDNWKKDDINAVVSYADIVEIVYDIAHSNTHIELVETFANMIADKCLRNDQIKFIDLKISKPDVIDSLSAVGVRLKKAR